MAIHIGTSGWHYLHWRGPFYPPGTHPDQFLKLYLTHFKTVELNNSFYRLPSEETLTAWRDAVPPSFRFAVKASRFITHNKKLKDSGDSFRLFFDRVRILGNRLGPVLFQLPPNWRYNGDRLEDFLSSLPRGPAYVFEFRNPDWMRDEAFTMLDRFGAGFCIHDMPDSRTPEIVVGKVVYVRFHGPEGKYQGSYPDGILSEWADKMREWSRKRKQVYCYFNNDIGGYAPHNALTLMGMVKNLEKESRLELV
ncbi:MAG: hypothetical protein JWP91_3988 [Fibrobacteres bacterium]|nr:hypothetical protein [Fibrobacterota bacterium]